MDEAERRSNGSEFQMDGTERERHFSNADFGLFILFGHKKTTDI